MKHARTALFSALVLLAPLASYADSGFYVGGSVGAATLEEDFDAFSIDSDSTAWRLTAGWQFGDYFGLEGGYQNFGDFDESFTVGGEPVDVRLKADGWTLGGTLSIPLSPSFSLYGRGGAFMWDADADVNAITEARADDTNPYYGGGAKVAITERLDLIGDWTRYELEDTESDVISLGLTFRF